MPVCQSFCLHLTDCLLRSTFPLAEGQAGRVPTSRSREQASKTRRTRRYSLPGRLVALDALRIKDSRHMARDSHLEAIFPIKPGQASGCEVHVVFPRRGIDMIHLSALDGNAVAKVPVIREHRSSATAVGGKPERGSRVPISRMVRGNARSNGRDVGIDYFQDPYRMRWLTKDQCSRGWSRHFLIFENIGNSVLARRGQSRGCEIDRVIPLLVRPVKDGENALPVFLFEEEDARLLVLG